MDTDNNQEPAAESNNPNPEGEDKTAKIPKPLKPGTVQDKDKKVVLNSGTDSTIRPSDATRMAPAPVPPAQAEETVTMEKDEIKDIPKVASSKNDATDDSTQKTTKPPVAASANNIKAKTIKLKPLKPTDEGDDNQEETLSMDRSSVVDKDMPSTLGAPPQAKPKEAPPAAPGVDDEATIKIQKPTTNKPTHPVPSIPGSKETIKLRPSNTPPPPAGAASEAEEQETVSMSKKTIRLVPKKPGEETGSSAAAKPTATAKPSAPTVKLTDSSRRNLPAGIGGSSRRRGGWSGGGASGRSCFVTHRVEKPCLLIRRRFPTNRTPHRDTETRRKTKYETQMTKNKINFSISLLSMAHMLIYISLCGIPVQQEDSTGGATRAHRLSGSWPITSTTSSRPSIPAATPPDTAIGVRP